MGGCPVNAWLSGVQEATSQLQKLAQCLSVTAACVQLTGTHLPCTYSGKLAGCTVQQCTRARRCLDQHHLVLVLPDMVTNGLVLCSRSAYIVRLHQLFVDCTGQSQVTSSSVAAWKDQYQRNQWSKFGRWEHGGSVACSGWLYMSAVHATIQGDCVMCASLS
jgi:hypothetical protein